MKARWVKVLLSHGFLACPRLTVVRLFLVGALIYETPTDTGEELVARVNAATDQNIAEVFERVRLSMLRRCRLCVDIKGGRSEHLL